MTRKGFTLIEVLIAVGLLGLVATVSLSSITNLVRSAAKSQSGVDVEQASNFVLAKMENDIRNSSSAAVSGPGSNILLLTQSTGVVTYSLESGSSGASNYVLYNNTTRLTDEASISLDLTNSFFSVINDAEGSPVAVNVRIKFIKPVTLGTKIFDAEDTLDTTIVLRGAY